MDHPLRVILRNPELGDRACEIIKRVARKAIADGKPDHDLFEVVIRRHKKNRSLDQNALYWQWLTIISADLRTGKDDLHEQFKGRFAIPILIRDDEDFAAMVKAVKAVTNYGPLARKVVALVSTTSFTVKQMSEYLDEVSQYALSLDIALPHPEDRFLP